MNIPTRSSYVPGECPLSALLSSDIELLISKLLPPLCFTYGTVIRVSRLCTTFTTRKMSLVLFIQQHLVNLET